MLRSKISLVLRFTERSYHRPAKKNSIISKFNSGVEWGWNRWFNPRNPDGSVSHYRLHQLGALFFLVNFWTYHIYKEYNLYQAGEETIADKYWTSHGIDLGFRSITREDKEEPGEKAVIE